MERQRKPDDIKTSGGLGKRPKVLDSRSRGHQGHSCTSVRIGVVMVVVLAASSVVGHVIIAGIVLLPPPRDQI